MSCDSARLAERFDGTASFMRAASFLLNRNEITVIAVSALRVEGSNPHLATYGGASNLGRLYYSAASGNALLQRGATNAVWTADQAGLGFKTTTFMCRNDGTNELFIGGTSRATLTDATAIPVSAAFDIGAYNNGAGFFAPIDYARILVYNKALTTAQRTQVEAQLSADYGV